MGRLGIYSVLLLLCFPLNAQELLCFVNRQQVKLGEPIKLYLQVTMPQDASFSFDPIHEPLVAEIYTMNVDATDTVLKQATFLEQINSFSIDTEHIEETKRIWKGHYTLIAWDEGEIYAQPPKMTINDSSYFFSKTSFVVIPPMGKDGELFDIEETYTKISDKVSFIVWLSKHWGWWLAMSVVITGITLWIVYKRSKKTKMKHNMSLKDRTLFAIDALYKQKLWEKDMLKLHYSELSYIVRAYLSARYELPILECTTQQTYVILQETNIERTIILRIIDILKHADIIKFANVMYNSYDVEELKLRSKLIVHETSPFELDTGNFIKPTYSYTK